MIRYKVFDKTKPRYRIAKHRYNLVNLSLFEEFNYYYPDLTNWQIFKKINERFAYHLRQCALNNREGIILPAQMGRISLRMFKCENPHLSLIKKIETDYKTGKICWDTRFVRYKIKVQPFYSFHAHRDFKGEAHERFSENPDHYQLFDLKDYIEQKNKKIQLENERSVEFNSEAGNISGEDT